MARFHRLDVLNQIVDTGLIPVFYHPDFETAKSIVHACSEAGLKIIEYTNRGEKAYPVFTELVSFFAKADPTVILGVGSVIDPYTAGAFILSGANFIVGPMLNPEVARICNRRKISYSPGCATASEISNAEEWGVEIVKIFPGDVIGGPKFVKSILAPMPWVRIMPTGGVDATQASIDGWFKAGVTAVGIGTNLIRRDWIETQQWDQITGLAAQVLSWIRNAQGKPLFSGLDHVCIYPQKAEAGANLAQWYQQLFGLYAEENAAGFFLSGGNEKGRIEVSKAEAGLRAHVAILTSDFEQAMQTLIEKGVELESPITTTDSRVAFLKNTDPAGNRVHIVWHK